MATPYPDASLAVEVGGESVSVRAAQTDSWGKFQTVALGRVRIKQSGQLTVQVRAVDPAAWKAINLNSVKLTPVQP